MEKTEKKGIFLILGGLFIIGFRFGSSLGLFQNVVLTLIGLFLFIYGIIIYPNNEEKNITDNPKLNNSLIKK